MDNLEKQLFNLPRPKMSLRADLKTKLKLYYLILIKSLSRFSNSLLSKNLALKRALIILLIIILLFSGTSIYAYTNNNITPGNAFYPLKRAVESVEKKLSLTDSSKVDTLEKFSERRLKEAVHLSNENLQNKQTGESQKVSNDISRTIDEAINNLGAAVRTTSEIKDETKAQENRNEIQNQQDSIIKYLNTIEQNASTSQDHEVFNKVGEAKQAINKYSDILKHQNEDNSRNGNPTGTLDMGNNKEKNRQPEITNSGQERQGNSENIQNSENINQNNKNSSVRQSQDTNRSRSNENKEDH
jgi:hypothetical protein